MDSNRSSDASSSIVEFLEKEKICQDSHKQTKIVGTNSHIDSTAPAQDMKNCSTSSDEEIGSLLSQMKELLSPVDLDYLDANEGRSVEDLLKEARQLMQTSPLYNQLENKSFCTEELHNHNVTDSPSKEENVPETQTHLEDADCDNGKMKKLIEEMEDLANSTTTIFENSINQPVVDKQKEIKTSLYFPPSSLRPSPIMFKSSSENIPIESLDSRKLSNEANQTSQANQLNGRLSNSTPSSELSQFDERSINENCRLDNFLDGHFKAIQDTNCEDRESKHDVPSKKLLKINTEALSLSDLEVPVKVDLINSSRLPPPKTLTLDMRNGEENEVAGLNLRDDNFGSTKNTSEIDIIKMEEDYTEEIKRLNLTIKLLQLKLAKYEEKNTPDCASGENGNQGLVLKDSDQLERLRAEIHTQERLIAGYQKENQRLFHEITAAKTLKAFDEDQQNYQRYVIFSLFS